MLQSPKVFISSPISKAGMLSYRDTTSRIVKLLGGEVIRSEEFGANPNDSIDVCLDRVSHADIFVLIMGNRYGSSARDNKSVTQLELEKAVVEKKKIFAYFIKDEVSIPNEVPDETTGENNVETIKAIIKNFGCYYGSFEDETSFAELLLINLGEHFKVDGSEVTRLRNLYVHSLPIRLVEQYDGMVKSGGTMSSVIISNNADNPIECEIVIKDGNVEYDGFVERVVPLITSTSHERTILISGQGGSGKSTLLARIYKSLCYKNIILYVPVFKLKYYKDAESSYNLFSYICDTYRSYGNNKDEILNCIKNTDGVFVLIDGYNELQMPDRFYDSLDIFDSDIEAVRHAGASIVVTSRYSEGVISSNAITIKIQPLAKETVKNVLAKYQPEFKMEYDASEINELSTILRACLINPSDCAI